MHTGLVLCSAVPCFIAVAEIETRREDATKDIIEAQAITAAAREPYARMTMNRYSPMIPRPPISPSPASTA